MSLTDLLILAIFIVLVWAIVIGTVALFLWLRGQ